MTKHGAILEEFKERASNFDPTCPKDLTSLKLILIKACDVSNEVRPMGVSEPWADRLMQEYFQQVMKPLTAKMTSKKRNVQQSDLLDFFYFILLDHFQ